MLRLDFLDLETILWLLAAVHQNTVILLARSTDVGFLALVWHSILNQLIVFCWVKLILDTQCFAFWKKETDD